MKFRAASFNVENLILPGIHFYQRFDHTREEYEAKANWTASILNRAKADIVGLQEVWLDEAVDDVVKRCFFYAKGALIAVPGGARHENVEGRVAKRPRLGIISRFPIKQTATFTDFPPSVDLTIPLRIEGGKIKPVPVAITEFQRPVLRAVLDLDGHELVVYVAHLKSKGPLIAEGENGDGAYAGSLGQARATIVRAAEAVALRHLIVADIEHTKLPAIVLGDLNDTPDAASTQIVRGPSPHKDMTHEERAAMFDVVLHATHRIAFERSPSIHTHIHDGECDILDHILVSDEFHPRNPRRLGEVVRHDVINEHLRGKEDEPKPPGSSDHGIPIAEIMLRA